MSRILTQRKLYYVYSVKYSAKTDTLNDRCMHLTNYSINKFSSNYSKNEDVNACHGHKWTIKSLWTYLANRGVRTDCLWEALRSLVLRTILAGENGINSMIRANVESKYSCFELFGFDVILDSDLVPWLLEVNISPSLHSELPLDAHVKAPLVQGVLNTALYNVSAGILHMNLERITIYMMIHILRYLQNYRLISKKNWPQNFPFLPAHKCAMTSGFTLTTCRARKRSNITHLPESLWKTGMR